MPTAAEIIKTKIDALELVPDGWAASVEGFQPKLSRILTRLSSRLSLSDGFIELTDKNLILVSEIIEDLKSFMTSGEYVTFVKTLNAEFIAQQAVTVAYFETAFGSAPQTTFASTLYNIRRAEMVQTVIGTGLDPILYDKVRNALIDGIGSGSSYSDLLVTLDELALGSSTIDGVLLSGTRQLVSDGFATTDRQFTELISEELGVEWYRYLGGLIDTTRCFCKERNSKWYHRKEVQAWGMGKDIGKCRSGKGWKGMFRGTNAENIFVWVGGYNCQHSILPTSEFDVPKKDLKRAIAKGFYKPTKAVRTQLGL